MKFGPEIRDGSVVFRLWAPDADAVEVLVDDAPPMAMERRGEWFERPVAGCGAGARYGFRVGGLEVPDPASRMQAEDALGRSVVVATSKRAPSPDAIRPFNEAVIAEVHVGTVTPEGTFRALADHLPHFVAAGYTAIELMPVADFPGACNWGYDGVLPFAPDTRYGTVEDLRVLVRAAHDAGIAMILDVVYNHFGPEGNFLHAYASPFFTDRVSTPWGAAIDLAHPEVRAFFIENASMWLTDYDFDGLRFDAVHAFEPQGADIFMPELAKALRAVKPNAWLILENDDNHAAWLDRDDEGRPLLFTAQWNDDIHHAFHVAVTGETRGYYGDYAEDTVELIARALAEGFIYQGETSPTRQRPRGSPSAHLPPEAMIAFDQNHDQIGNRPFGDRLAGTIAPERLHLLRFVLMLSPHIPMLFQGEEALLTTPFPFFCDFQGDLADAVRKGRAEEFAAFFRDGGTGDAGGADGGVPPDPLSAETFLSAKQPWPEFETKAGMGALAAFRALADLRARLVRPVTASRFREARREAIGDHGFVTHWSYAAGGLHIAANFGPAAITINEAPSALDAEIGTVRHTAGRIELGPWSAGFWTTAG